MTPRQRFIHGLLAVVVFLCFLIPLVVFGQEAEQQAPECLAVAFVGELDIMELHAEVIVLGNPVLPDSTGKYGVEFRICRGEQ